MTKEDVLNKVSDEDYRNGWMLSDGVDFFDGTATTVFNAMDEWGKQEAISFKEWQDSNLEEKRWENYDGHDTWINPHTRQVISTEQLYDLYLQSKQK